MNPSKPYPTQPNKQNTNHGNTQDDDGVTVVINNYTRQHTTNPSTPPNKGAHDPPHDTIFHVACLNIAKEQAIADAGATGHFMIPGAPVTNVTSTKHPLQINLPDGKTIVSTHTCRLNVPWLPKKAQEAHIVPGLAHASLISINILRDAGCKVTYDEHTCRVTYNKKLVWNGHREPNTGLWVLSLSPTQGPVHKTPPDAAATTNHVATNAYTMTSKESLIKYLHQCLFSPPKRTLIKAIQNNQFTTWPGLTANAVQQYLPDSSPATDKGHMKRQKQGI
jgi:hypothetical protein